ncbi:alpha-ketoglutarate-dependent dioxygenase AlkB [Bacillus sp. NP157]|nr:alpha-ketoglutarate-dependent dioxygenase AlkB [Bacillus sp. NP157]
MASRIIVPGTPDLFDTPAAPEGFRYLPDVLGKAEERDIVRRFEQLALQPYEFRGFPANRRIFTFGPGYLFAGQKARPDSTVPAYLHPLMELAARISGKPASAFAQLMVTEYAPGAGIGWHLDRPNYEDIASVSFLAPCALRLRRKTAQGWDRLSIPIEPRSIYLLQGDARTAWQHSIAPMDALRYSVTLRTLRTAAGTTARTG